MCKPRQNIRSWPCQGRALGCEECKDTQSSRLDASFSCSSFMVRMKMRISTLLKWIKVFYVGVILEFVSLHGRAHGTHIQKVDPMLKLNAGTIPTKIEATRPITFGLRQRPWPQSTVAPQISIDGFPLGDRQAFRTLGETPNERVRKLKIWGGWVLISWNQPVVGWLGGAMAPPVHESSKT
jgi:hypothetical protein